MKRYQYLFKTMIFLTIILYAAGIGLDICPNLRIFIKTRFLDVCLADAAAFAILQFERDDYSYAYNISEGYKVDESCMPNKDYNRKRLLFEEYTGKNDSAAEYAKEIQKQLDDSQL